MILTGPAIRAALANDAIECEPFDPAQVAQVSLDLHLDPTLLVTVPPRSTEGRGGVCISYVPRGDWHDAMNPDDPLKEQETWPITMGEDGLILYPGCLYLGSTIEAVSAPGLTMFAHGKSSLARRGLEVHNAGVVEPGFRGNITLELIVAHPLRVRPGMPVAQVTFHTMAGEVESYGAKGNYTGALASGPIPSQSHKHKPRHYPVKP